jgi:hypothetical protein
LRNLIDAKRHFEIAEMRNWFLHITEERNLAGFAIISPLFYFNLICCVNQYTNGKPAIKKRARKKFSFEIFHITGDCLKVDCYNSVDSL